MVKVFFSFEQTDRQTNKQTDKQTDTLLLNKFVLENRHFGTSLAIIGV
jgi:hypothetical protein